MAPIFEAIAAKRPPSSAVHKNGLFAGARLSTREGLDPSGALRRAGRRRGACRSSGTASRQGSSLGATERSDGVSGAFPCGISVAFPVQNLLAHETLPLESGNMSVVAQTGQNLPKPSLYRSGREARRVGESGGACRRRAIRRCGATLSSEAPGVKAMRSLLLQPTRGFEGWQT